LILMIFSEHELIKARAKCFVWYATSHSDLSVRLVQFMACLVVIFLGEIVGGVLAIIFKDSVSYICYYLVIILYYKICI